MTKESIIQKHWPKPSQSDSVTAWKEAISKMMDEATGVVYNVTGCKDCPMCNRSSDGWNTEYICNYNLSLPDENEFEIKDENTIPDWCPLNKESITISKQ